MITETVKSKILVLDELIDKVKELKEQGKTVVQSHGIFDIIHPGIIKHLKSAKQQGDVLVVTVVKDKDVRKGPGRPIFPEKFRAETTACLEDVDYVCVVDDAIPFECVERIEPNIFAKGIGYKDRDKHIHEELFKEEKEFYLGKSKIYETGGFSFSSSEIINNFLDIYPEDTKAFLKDFAKKYSFKDISDRINSLKELKVLIVGDGIIDEYHYCEGLSRSAKSNLVVSKYLTHEIFCGGAFAIANHIAGICGEVKLVTLLGEQDTRQDFILSNLKPNISPQFFYRADGPTIIKKRYVNPQSNQKLFEVNYINDHYPQAECEQAVIDYLQAQVSKYDVVLVSDFGHGFITNKMMGVIEKFSRKWAVNTQTNAANAGYNLITKYHRPNFVCLDESELRLAAQEKFSNIENVAKRILARVSGESLIVTLGRKGSIGVNTKGEINHTPVFSSKVIDTVGAGDAFFSFTAPCSACAMPLDLVSFIGNAVGALAVQIVCNKKPVEKYELLEFVHTLLK